MTRAWFLWFMMSPGPIDGVVAPLFTIALLFILCNKWLQFNHQSKLLKHLGGNCDVTVVVSMATAIPLGSWYRGNQEHPGGQEWAPASERATWGTRPRGENPLIATGYHIWKTGMQISTSPALTDLWHWFHAGRFLGKSLNCSVEMESKTIFPAQFYFV